LTSRIGPKSRDGQLPEISFARPHATIEKQLVFRPKYACLAKVESVEVLDLT
jgi:hypothetical protein